MKSQKGFSLIELLVVATIIIVLSTIGIVSFSNSGKTARDNRRKADLETVRQALVLYRNEQGGYPPPISSGGDKVKYGVVVGDLADAGYLSDPTPLDPKNDETYFYGYTSTFPNPTFCLCAQLETDKGNKNSRSCEGSYLTSGQFFCVQQP